MLRRSFGAFLERRLPDRTQELLTGLLAATGNRPRLPITIELDKVRYTLITAAFGLLGAFSP